MASLYLLTREHCSRWIHIYEKEPVDPLRAGNGCRGCPTAHTKARRRDASFSANMSVSFPANVSAGFSANVPARFLVYMSASVSASFSAIFQSWRGQSTGGWGVTINWLDCIYIPCLYNSILHSLRLTEIFSLRYIEHLQHLTLWHSWTKQRGSATCKTGILRGPVNVPQIHSGCHPKHPVIKVEFKPLLCALASTVHKIRLTEGQFVMTHRGIY